MSKDDILVQLTQVIKGVMPDCLHNHQLKINDRFVEDLGFDSIAILMLGSSIEEQFDVSATDKDIHKFKTVSDVVEYIYNHQNNK